MTPLPPSAVVPLAKGDGCEAAGGGSHTPLLHLCSSAANTCIIFDTFAPRGCTRYLVSHNGRNVSICSRSMTDAVRLASRNPDCLSRRNDSATSAFTISSEV